METRKSFYVLPFSSLLIFLLIIISLCEGKGSSEEQHVKAHEGPLVKKSQIKTIVDTEYGEISSIMVKEGQKSPPYHLQFFTLEPNSVFLPVLLHADMVFYVYTGSGRLTWANEDGGTGTIDLREGDVCSLGEGFVFYIQSNLEAQRNKLRIYAMFSNTEDSTFDSSIGAYSRINNLVKGFDKKIMQAAFKVPEDLVEAITNKTETPAIVHAVPEKKDKHKHNDAWELEALFPKYFTGILSNSKKKLKTYNIFTNDPDFKNVHGWTTTVTKKQLKQLKRHNIGFLMVNLTMASMLGPHWNPRATEIAVVLQGEGMVRVVCGSNNDSENTDECQNKRFRVKQGDVFVVPRFHPMAHMSFENEPLAFMGFSTAAKKNNPQFLVGKGSVLETLDRQILATSLGVSNRTIDKLLASPDESIIFGCESCAEEEERLMKEDEEKEKEEEEKRKKEEKEEEETEKSKEEEEEREKRRKEEEEEEVRRREEARKREEEAARRQQEERERRREEEEARRREQERREEKEEAAREQEKARRQRKEEEARRERERQEEAATREEEQKRKEEEEAAAKREQEKARKQQEERERKREEEAKREREREEEAAAREEEQRREEEKERRREEEEARRERKREEEVKREREREEEAAREEEQRREEEKEEARREREGEEEAAKRQQEERERRREEEAEREQERGREEEPAEGEEEAARRQQEERERRREEEGGREREEEQSERERGGGGRRRRQRRREEESPAEGEEEAARRQQEERERRRGEEGEREREEEQSERERGGGGRRRRRHRGGEERGDESEASWEEEESRREQEERERRRERGRDNKSMKRKVEGRSFEGSRVLKMRNVNV